MLNSGEREDWDGFEVRLSLFGVHGDAFGAPQPCSRRLVRSEKIYTTLQNPKVLRIVLFSLSMIFWNVFETNYGKQRPKSQISKNGGLVKGKPSQTQAIYDCEIGEIWKIFRKIVVFKKS